MGVIDVLQATKRSVDLSESKLALSIGGIEGLQVIRFEGTEGVSRLYNFEIEVASTEPLGSYEALVGRDATLTVTARGGKRLFHGIVGRFTHLGEGPDRTYYRIELVSRLWLLTHRYDSRIFQNMTVPEIVEEVLQDAGVVDGVFRIDMKLVDRYPKRTYCVQYRETDFNFVSRLLEEEGIFYYIVHDTDACRWVLADTPLWAPLSENAAALPFRPPTGMAVDEDHVFQFHQSHEVRPGAVVLRDYNDLKPSLDLQCDSRCASESRLEISDYPGRYESQVDGYRVAQKRSEEMAARRVTNVGRSNCCRLAPGHEFALVEHASKGFNASYALTSVTHRGRQAIASSFDDSYGHISGPSRIGTETEGLWLYHEGQVATAPAALAAACGGAPWGSTSAQRRQPELDGKSGRERQSPVYECEFECIPSHVRYRPPRVTPKPLVRGAQTAVVVGPNGQEIFTDEYGRVKVQFNWDRKGRRDGNSSLWIRVSHPWAGGGFGGIAIPRIGQEVIVDFLEGDPDRPIIVGRVYNGELQAPSSLDSPSAMTGAGPQPIAAMQNRAQGLPAAAMRTSIKSRSTPGGGGGNEITFDDAAGGELFYTNATKDSVRTVGSDDTTTVGSNRQLSVGSNLSEFVGANHDSFVAADETITIGANQTQAIGADRTETVGSNHTETIGANNTATVGANDTETIGANRSATVAANDSLAVGSDRSVQVAGAQTLTVGKSRESAIALFDKLSIGLAGTVDVGLAYKVSAGVSVTLTAPGGSITIGPSGISIDGKVVTITGGTVHINP